jgi:hypothetical protein
MRFKASYDLFGFSTFHQSCYLAAIKGRQSILPSELACIAFFSRGDDRDEDNEVFPDSFSFSCLSRPHPSTDLSTKR